MALNTCIVGLNKIKAHRIDDVRSRWMCNMQASGPVTPFAHDVPFGDSFCLDVVVHRMTSVTERTSRPPGVVRRVQRSPPVGSILYEVRPPDLVRYIPLGRQHKVVVTNLLEVSLLPYTRAMSSLLNVTSESDLERSGRMAAGCSLGSRTTFAICGVFHRS